MDVILEEAIRLRRLGFAVHWLWPKSKAPIAGGWSEVPVMEVPELTNSYRPGFNLGFRPGRWSVVDGKEICVLDIDVRGGELYADEARAAAKNLLRDAYSPTVQSGSGPGLHQYLRFPVGQSPGTAAITIRESDVWVRARRGRSSSFRPARTLSCLPRSIQTPVGRMHG